MSTVDLLVLTCSDQLLFYKTTHLNEEAHCTESSPSVSVHWLECLSYASNVSPSQIFDGK
jgi:hypothetical protein